MWGVSLLFLKSVFEWLIVTTYFMLTKFSKLLFGPFWNWTKLIFFDLKNAACVRGYTCMRARRRDRAGKTG